jgi:hypothetical protein
MRADWRCASMRTSPVVSLSSASFSYLSQSGGLHILVIRSLTCLAWATNVSRCYSRNLSRASLLEDSAGARRLGRERHGLAGTGGQRRAAAKKARRHRNQEAAVQQAPQLPSLLRSPTPTQASTKQDYPC